MDSDKRVRLLARLLEMIIISSSLELDDARRRERVLVEMQEEPLPEGYNPMPTYSSQ